MKIYASKDEKERKELINSFYEDYKNYLSLILDNILKKVELRTNAYILNLMSSKKKVIEYLQVNFKREHFEVLINDADPKTRKNTYVLMGNLLNKDYVIDLVKMLKKEETNYCISSLILTLGNYKIKNLKEILEKYEEILISKLNDGLLEEVHYKEITNSINKVLNKNEKKDMHEFVCFDRDVYLFLTCMEPLINSTFMDVKRVFSDARKYKNGVIVKTSDINKVYSIRTFYEALISYNSSFDLSLNEVKGNIVSFLKSNILENSHTNINGSFAYRIEYQTVKNRQDKLNVYNEIVTLIENEFKNKYINNPSQYEFEIRIVEHDDKYDVLYKLYTYKDNRYAYRVKDLPASINPTSAAIMLNEVSKYLKEDNSVLDPFCGTSTMLIERNYLSRAKLTGVDVSNNAIECSKINTKANKLAINLIKQNCLDHKGYYDEIISNMPYGNRVGTHNSNELLYKDFISKLPSLLNENGVAILLTSEISLIKKLLKNKTKLKLVRDIYCETGGLTPHLFVIKKV